MEYLVTMTTQVPDGTAEQAVDDVRAREAARSSELAAQGYLLRLWRPPLAPGEWRTLGLFAGANDDEVEQVLASMPLRVWRTDEVTPLLPHPNDPVNGPPLLQPGTEFFTTFTIAIPPGTPAEAVAGARAGEKARTRELAGQGYLVRLWELPGDDRALGLWRAADSAQMQSIVDSLPLDPMMTTDITALTPHPNDPAMSASRS